jgi:predicted short-subunit dehydrogenase-like oxidoreductase (DUF2520 family)
MGAGEAVASFADFKPADYWIVAVPDVALTSVATRLAEQAPLQPTHTVFHCSGLHTLAVLEPLRARVKHLASLHPMQSFSDKERAFTHFAGVVCGIEGDPAVYDDLAQWVARWGATAVPIPSDKKLIYHAMAVFCSNYWVTLAQVAVQCGQLAGLSEKMALQAMKPMMEVTCANVVAMGPKTALSGPIARLDSEAVRMEWDALNAVSPALASLYTELGLATLSLLDDSGVRYFDK